jgi:undecaprenyl-diphosphatase
LTDFSVWAQAIGLGIVEGVTEFLPVSSTGHLILAGYFVKFPEAMRNIFVVVIQLGAILAVVVLYWRKLWGAVLDLPRAAKARHFALSVIVAFLPAAVLGAALHDFIERALFKPWIVATTFILGGIAILAIERLTPAFRHHEADRLPIGTSLGIGLFQCIAMIPGVSRSGATILGAMLLRVDRRAAAEFSFFLAIPTMLGATVLDLYKGRTSLTASDYEVIALGFAVAFVSAIIVVRAFVTFLQNHTFVVFGWYRILAGLVLMLVLWRST